jgi:hypothetical protein
VLKGSLFFFIHINQGNINNNNKRELVGWLLLLLFGLLPSASENLLDLLKFFGGKRQNGRFRPLSPSSDKGQPFC